MDYKKTKHACYFAYLSMSTVFSLPSILFVTFHELYGISYTLLGTLVLTNFCTQMIVDLIFTFFTKYFNIKRTIRIMPIITSVGMIVYSVIPILFQQFAFVGLCVGTVIFSIAAGLSEVLLSPTIAAIPSDHPERDMSFLHSLYAYGVVTVVIISTLFIEIFGAEKWMYLMLFWAILPIICSIMFFMAPLPDMNISHSVTSDKSQNRFLGIALCVMCIFMGSAAENTMTNWISGYIENALHISKTLGDILGLTVFAILLGVGRTLYAKYGKNISSVLLWGMIGSFICYIVAGISPYPFIALAACALVGFFTSMLWPGALILMEDNFPQIGVFAYALMAAGGDFGHQ